MLHIDMGITAPALATIVGLLGAVLGIWLTGLRQQARAVIPFSAGVLLGVAIFGLVPELASEIGWPVSMLLFAVGYSALLLVNRFVYRVCPTCAHDHDHNACSTELHRVRSAVDYRGNSPQLSGWLERGDGATRGAAGTARGGAAGGGAA